MTGDLGAYAASAVATVFLLCAGTWAMGVLIAVVIEEHRAGMARVRGDQSWSPDEADYSEADAA